MIRIPTHKAVYHGMSCQGVVSVAQLDIREGNNLGLFGWFYEGIIVANNPLIRPAIFPGGGKPDNWGKMAFECVQKFLISFCHRLPVTPNVRRYLIRPPKHMYTSGCILKTRVVVAWVSWRWSYQKGIWWIWTMSSLSRAWTATRWAPTSYRWIIITPISGIKKMGNWQGLYPL